MINFIFSEITRILLKTPPHRKQLSVTVIGFCCCDMTGLIRSFWYFDKQVTRYQSVYLSTQKYFLDDKSLSSSRKM